MWVLMLCKIKIKRKDRLDGHDLCFKEMSQIAGYITSVSGGIGPATIAMLMKKTRLSFLRFMASKFQVKRKDRVYS